MRGGGTWSKRGREPLNLGAARKQEGIHAGFIQSCRPVLNHEVPWNLQAGHQGLQGWQGIKKQHSND
ncbi:hypothetical protein SAMN05216417_1102 [Nitrosospira multiformis]|uniref:Uncharacterized protein n=1 Tax=Nitrosospira multiformis TaxID=1231 RepID=A0A1I7HJV9_9PROT|nr:hypothetical protein SAMN05216417_1102 [Nitrosospira multiformis]